MPSVIFSGSKVKTLKDTLNLNGGSDIITSTTDPTTSAVSAEPGSLLLNKTTGFVYRKLDSGSSTNWTLVGSEAGGAKSYATGNDSTGDSALGSGWTTADVTAYPPTTYSGGTVTATFARTTLSPLQGAGSMLFTPGGQYDSAVFTFPNGIDRSDFARMHKIEFDYEIGTVASYTDGDVKLAVVCASDSGFTTNVQVIQPAGHSISKVSGQETHVATFQSHASNLYYKIFLIQTTASTGYTLKIDNFKVGPQSVTYGAPVTDWYKKATVIEGATSNPTKGATSHDQISYRRVGDSLEVQLDYRQTGAGTNGSGAWIFRLPDGLVIDGNKIIAESYGAIGAVGVGEVLIGSTGYSAVLKIWDTTHFYLNILNSVSPSDAANSTNADFTNTTLRFSFHGTVPILGWSSNVVVSDSADTRVVAAQAQSTGRNYSTGSDQVLLWSSKQIDTHGKFDVSTGLYTCPVPGIYEISASIDTMANNGGGQWAAGNVLQLKAYKNGSFYAYMDRYQQQNTAAANGYAANVSGTAKIQCNAGDTIGAYIFGNCTSPMLSNGGETITIKLLSGPAQIAASESVIARYGISTSSTSPASGTMSNATTYVLDYDTKFKDSHGSVTTGSSWKFTAPISGVYKITAAMTVAGTNTPTVGGSVFLALHKNGSGSRDSIISLFPYQVASAAYNPRLNGSATIELLAGEYVDVRIRNNSGASQNLSRGTDDSQITIVRTGNY